MPFLAQKDYPDDMKTYETLQKSSFTIAFGRGVVVLAPLPSSVERPSSFWTRPRQKSGPGHRPMTHPLPRMVQLGRDATEPIISSPRGYLPRPCMLSANKASESVCGTVGGAVDGFSKT